MVTPRSQRLTISKLVPTSSANSAWVHPLRLRARRNCSFGTNSSGLTTYIHPPVGTLCLTTRSFRATISQKAGIEQGKNVNSPFAEEEKDPFHCTFIRPAVFPTTVVFSHLQVYVKKAKITITAPTCQKKVQK